MTDPRFDLRQMVRLTPEKRNEYPDIGNLPGMIERILISRRELTVHWQDRGVRINLTFDEVETIDG